MLATGWNNAGLDIAVSTVLDLDKAVEFKAARQAVMSNARCQMEGINVPAVPKPESLATH